MRHFRDENEKVKDDDFPMIGLHSQRNEDYFDVYKNLGKNTKEKSDKKKNS